MKKHWMTLAGLACTGLAQAHEGHGLPGLSHWHANDVGMLLALAAVIGLSLWLSRRK
jgi:hypothetical protein